MDADHSPSRRVLIAPDSFKGTFSARQVAEAVAGGVRQAGLAVELCPIADGGEGTLDVLLGNGQRRLALAHDPVGRPIRAYFGIRGEVAIVETAAASGLVLVAEHERDALAATTRGTGELIAAAISAGARTVYVGMGGSATTDGGSGAVSAITAGGGTRGARIVTLCDVSTPFEDAARIFAPQKGANPCQVKQLSERLQTQAASYPRDPRGVPGTGAAGGLAGALWAVYGAEIVRGSSFVLDELDFDRRCQTAAAVVTGEGRLDEQSRVGKAVSEVAARAGRLAVPCYAIVGSTSLGGDATRRLGLAEVHIGRTLDEMRAAATQVAQSLALGSPAA